MPFWLKPMWTHQVVGAHVMTIKGLNGFATKCWNSQFDMPMWDLSVFCKHGWKVRGQMKTLTPFECLVKSWLDWWMKVGNLR